MDNKVFINDLNNQIESNDFWSKIPELNIGHPSFLSPIIGSREVILGRLLMSILNPIVSPNLSLEGIQLLYDKISDILEEKKLFEIDIFGDNFEVDQEFITHANGRIDFLIRTTDKLRLHRKAIIIELKIDSDLQNDLEDYYNSVNVENRNKVGVILSLRDTSHLLEETQFVHIPLIDFLNELIESSTSTDPRDLTFLQEVKLFLQDLNSSFYGQYTSDYIRFIIENKEIINQIVEVYKLNENDSERNMFIRRNFENLSKLEKIRQYTTSNIQSYFDTASARLNRIKYHLREDKKFYLKGKQFKLFPDLVRLLIDYSGLENNRPQINITASINTNQINLINGQNSDRDLISKLKQITHLSPFFVENGGNDSNGTIFFTKAINNVNELIKINSLFEQIEAEIITPIEQAVEKVLFDKSIIVRRKFDDLGRMLKLKHSVHINHPFGISGEEVILNDISDGFYIITYKLTENNEIIIRIWLLDGFFQDAIQNYDDLKDKIENFKNIHTLNNSREFIGEEQKLHYEAFLEAKFEVRYTDIQNLNNLINDIWNKIHSTLKLLLAKHY